MQTFTVAFVASLVLLSFVSRCSGYYYLQPSKEEDVVESYPVFLDDGQDSYLILNENELANNEEILAHLSSAGKDEVEEIVDRNPAMQETLLKRIRDAVEVRNNRHLEKDKLKVVAKQKDSIKLKPNKYDKKAEEEEEEEDDDEPESYAGFPGRPIDEGKIKHWQTKIRDKATKIFKIGRGFKDKLVAMARKKAHKKNDKNSKKNRNRHRWPHFHYSISTN